MAYTAVKGGQAAIAAAEALTLDRARADAIPAAVIERAQRLLVDQVMGEGGLYAPSLAAKAIAQAEGDPIEAAFLVRAYRSTLPRLGYSLPSDGVDLRILRRISSAFKEIVGGQVLGRTRDYTQRLLDLDCGVRVGKASSPFEMRNQPRFPKVVDELRAEGLIARTTVRPDQDPFDVTREAPRFPAPRSARLQMLARGETGFLVAMAFSSLRGFGAAHPTIAELRFGDLPVRIVHPLTGEPVSIGAIAMTEVEGVNHAETGVGGGGHANLEREESQKGMILGYGATFGQNERKAIAMSILDMGLNIPGNSGPAADEEFVLQHCDAVESSGFVEHLKLPHYVTFQSQLERMRFSRFAQLSARAKAAKASRL